ncbi:copper resistance CopC/CopD family protein [Streptomyces triticisoli]|uniref:copper resistance CopC/CopD family protein n=1 Tax=Streptomyces triticisoli TaxID=2182797 RepID=UPI000DD81071|nr:copper resistance protein CopC [Streptomyces triticisoli]
MSQTITPRVRNLVLLLLAAIGLLLAGAAPASAHAALTGSDPQQGVVVDKAPGQVSLTFSEQVALNDDSLRVLDPKGNRVDAGKPANVSGTTYAVQLRGGLPDGTYTVVYQVVSADSHPVGGAYTFSIGAPSKTSAAVGGQEAGGGLVGALHGFGRYVSYAGFIVLVGGAAFVLACWQRGSGVRAVQRLVVSGWVTLTASTLMLLLLRGSYTTSGKAGDIFDLTLLGQVLQTKTGAALVSRLLLLAAAALFVAVLFGAHGKRDDQEKQDGEEKRDPSLGLAIGGTAVAAGIAASWSMAEHASTGLQTGIAMPVDVIHLLAVATWLGGLVTLLVALYGSSGQTPVETAAVRRFSRLAFGSVLALVATGTYQSWRQAGSWQALTGTRYGQLLLVKIGLVVLLVGIASISRRWTGRLAETVTAQAAVTTHARVPATAGKTTGSDEKTGTDAESGSGGKPGPDGEPGGEGKPGPDEKAKTGGRAANGDTSQRAAQLARQRAAVDTARRKRLRDADPGRLGLRRSVLAEAAVAVVLLAVTTALTQTEPGRTEVEAKAATSSSSSSSSEGAVTLDMPFDTGGQNGKGLVRLDIDPARVGGNDLHVYVQRTDGRPYDIPEVKVAFSLAAKKLGPLPVAPDRIATGHWAASGVQIPMAGDWQIEVTVRTSDIDQVTVTKNAQIG